MADKAKAKKPQSTYTLLGVRVDDHDVDVDATVNPHVHYPQHAFGLSEDDPLFRHVTTLRLVGTSTYPDERAGHGYEVTISSDDAPSRGMDRKLRDVQARDKFGSPAYRTYRGRQIPVYKPPAGLGMIEKVRGQQAWTVWVDLTPRLVTDMLVLLGQSRRLFLSIYEHKLGRARWVNSLSLQTTDPAEE